MKFKNERDKEDCVNLISVPNVLIKHKKELNEGMFNALLNRRSLFQKYFFKMAFASNFFILLFSYKQDHRILWLNLFSTCFCLLFDVGNYFYIKKVAARTYEELLDLAYKEERSLKKD